MYLHRIISCIHKRIIPATQNHIWLFLGIFFVDNKIDLPLKNLFIDLHFRDENINAIFYMIPLDSTKKIILSMEKKLDLWARSRVV